MPKLLVVDPPDEVEIPGQGELFASLQSATRVDPEGRTLVAKFVSSVRNESGLEEAQRLAGEWLEEHGE